MSSRRQIAAHHLFVLLLATGCLSGPPKDGPRSLDDMTELASRLGTTRISTCDEEVKPDWPFSVFHRNPRLIEQQGQLILLYDLIGRNRSRTIWQPLGPDLAFLGDGIAVGHPKASRTEDFQLTVNALGNLWTSFRFRLQGSLRYGAALEFLDQKRSGKIERFLLPVPPQESVQQIWAMPAGAPRNELSIVVKTYDVKPSENEESWADVETEAIYRWFLVSPERRLVKEIRSAKAPAETFGELSFVPRGDGLEPLALAIESTVLPAAGKSEALPAQRVTATRLFDPKQQKVVIFQAPGALLSSLDVLLVATPERRTLHFAWVYEPESGRKPLLQWVSLGFRPEDKELASLFATPMLVDNKSLPLIQSFLPISHYPTQLTWRSLPNAQGGTQERLTWLATLNADIAHMSTAPLTAPLSAGGPNPSGLYAPQKTLAYLTSDATRQIHGVYSRPNTLGDTLMLFTPRGEERPKIESQESTHLAGVKTLDIHVCSFKLGQRGAAPLANPKGESP